MIREGLRSEEQQTQLGKMEDCLLRRDAMRCDAENEWQKEEAAVLQPCL